MPNAIPTLHLTTPDQIRKLNALFYGPTGNGKTRLLGTAQDDPRTSPMLFVDFEGGTSTLAGKDIDIQRILKWEDFDDVVNFLRFSDHKYKSVGVDSVSESHVFSLLQLLDSDRRRAIPDLLEQGDYGIALVQMRRLFRRFRDLPIHFMATSLVKDDVDPAIGKVYKPALVGALADEAPGIFDIVSYLGTAQLKDTDEVTRLHRVLVLQNYPAYRVKSRVPEALIPNFPDELIDPTITQLLDALKIE